MNNQVQLNPSDLTFLWDECKRCFYLKVVHKFERPRVPMAKIFNRIDRLMKGFFNGKSAQEISGNLPDGIVKYGEKGVTSLPIVVPGHSLQGVIKGRLDTVVEFSNATFSVVDFKTSEPKPEHVTFYGRQLHAYAYALENAAPGKLALSPITKLGLLVFEPANMGKRGDGKFYYDGNMTWLECPRDDQGFLDFIGNVLSILERPSPPPSDPSCAWCNYRDSARSTGL